MKYILPAVVFAFALLFAFPQNASAYSCTGTIYCQQDSDPTQWKTVVCSGVGTCTASCGTGWTQRSGSCYGCGTVGEYFQPCCSGLGVCALTNKCAQLVHDWSSWSFCSYECEGTQTRSCTALIPDCGGAHCSGVSTQSCGGCTLPKTCVNHKCVAPPTATPTPKCSLDASNYCTGSRPYTDLVEVPDTCNGCALLSMYYTIKCCSDPERLNCIACDDSITQCVVSSKCSNPKGCGVIKQGGSAFGTCAGCSPKYGINSYSCCTECRKYLGYRVCTEYIGSVERQYYAAECSQPTESCGGGCGGGGATPTPNPGCSATAPTNLHVTRNAGTTVTALNWTPGTGGRSQRLYVSITAADITKNCGKNTNCVISVTGLNKTLATYAVPSGKLVSGQTYFWRVVTYKSDSCQPPADKTFLFSCTLSPSGAMILDVGESQTLTAVVSASAAVNRVAFTPSSGAVSVDPPSDSNGADDYKTMVTGESATSPGFAGVTSVVYLTGDVAPACSDSVSVLVNTAGGSAWWQVVDSDVLTNGNLESAVPAGKYFGLAGAGGYPGVAAYGGATDLTGTNVSAKGWLANSLSSGLTLREYNYDYFASLAPDDVVWNAVPFESGGTASSDGYYWYKYDGTASGLALTVDSDVDLGSRKVILFVDGADLNLKGNINLTAGTGFFLAIVNGDINLDPGVTSLEGLYLADESFATGAGAAQLSVRGSVAAYGGFILQRDLGVDINPTLAAEVFEYAPEMTFLYPKALSVRKMRWKEVAP